MNSDKLYFAYGSNMDRERIREPKRCPNAEFLCTGRLAGHKLAFTRRSIHGHGVADALIERRQVVWGVVWRIKHNELEQLDTQEGAKAKPPKYIRHQVSVYCPAKDEELTCETYFVAPDQREGQNISSTKEYVGHLLNGAKAHRLPSHYVAKLKRLWEEADES